MKRSLLKALVVLFLIGIFGSLSITLAAISPPTLTATLRPCESITETKTVDLPAELPKGDIMFSFDCTGSMRDDIAAAKTAASYIIGNVSALVTSPQYGVISYADYNGYYSCCGYSATYGGGSDYPYNLDLSLTDNEADVISAINALPNLGGGDGPQCYTRIMYESYSDPAIVWRTGARKIVINFGDNVPHDCDINQDVPGTTGVLSTGCDPGRNAVCDGNPGPHPADLDLQTTINEMIANNIVWLEIHGTGTGFSPHWQHWAGLTGGSAYQLTTVDPEAVAEAVATLIEELVTHLDTLTLEVDPPEFAPWVTWTPTAYYDLTLPTTVTFDVTVHVPMGTDPGTYTFKIKAVGNGADYGEQTVTITVPSPPVGGFWVPINMTELLAPWIGLASLIIVASASAVYVKRRKNKH